VVAEAQIHYNHPAMSEAGAKVGGDNAAMGKIGQEHHDGHKAINSTGRTGTGFCSVQFTHFFASSKMGPILAASGKWMPFRASLFQEIDHVGMGSNQYDNLCLFCMAKSSATSSLVPGAGSRS